VTEERLCPSDDIRAGTARRFVVGKHRICLVRIGDDLYPIGDVCTHEEVSLAEGQIYEDEREIECWKHGSTFSLVTGEARSLPAVKPEPVYEVREDGIDVIVRLP
jgi:3-phenylpropionate/trans-cinnamate dioxygenase ferredoxin subunit